MELVELVFGFIAEHLKFHRIKLKTSIFVGFIVFFVAAFMFCWWNGI